MKSSNRDDLQAVLWDLDGTLVDTEPFWMAAQQELALNDGLNWTTDDAHSGRSSLSSGSKRAVPPTTVNSVTSHDVLQLLANWTNTQTVHKTNGPATIRHITGA
ncbi:hypothetical protein [Arthrobacter sp. 754]|uniref:hypothetical protein n=1 Tax=Arthrobacter sp. 754 TaxID=3156315 RepID=UPI00339B1570